MSALSSARTMTDMGSFMTEKIKYCIVALALACMCRMPFSTGDAAPLYQGNRAPLVEKPYIELPLGAVKARGWL